MNETHLNAADPLNALFCYIKAVEKNQEVSIIKEIPEFVGSERRK